MRFQPFEKFTIAAMVATLAMLGLALPAAAEEETAAKKERTVIKATMHIDVSEAESVLSLLDVRYAVKPDQNEIVIRGDSYAVDTALKVIDALDVPRPSIDLRVYVLSASKEGQGDNVPAELEGAVDQLRGVFGYSGFELLDNVMLKVLEGRRARADGAIRLEPDADRVGYQFSFRKVSVVFEDETLMVRIKDLKFEVNGQTEGTVRASLMTDVQILEGQKAVIGSSTPQGVGETLILIVEAMVPPDPNAKKE